MKIIVVTLVTALLIIGHLPFGLTTPYTAPAFLWSPHQDGYPNRITEGIKYRTLFPRDLAKLVMSEGGWSNFLVLSGGIDLAYHCSLEAGQKSLDFAVLFVGKELRSRDISRPIKADQILMSSLRGSFWNSNFSLAFPYIALAEENEAMENYLISQFIDTCGNSLEMGSIAVLESCTVEGETFEKLKDISAVQDFMFSKMEKKSRGGANLIVVCHGVSPSQSMAEVLHSEGEFFSHVMSSIQQLNATYTALYVSDPLGSVQHRPYQGLERFLAEGAFGNRSTNSTVCDGVCQIKSSILEGILVGIVLLIILISGLCCMAGIDTPARFEVPQDS